MMLPFLSLLLQATSSDRTLTTLEALSLPAATIGERVLNEPHAPIVFVYRPGGTRRPLTLSLLEMFSEAKVAVADSLCEAVKYTVQLSPVEGVTQGLSQPAVPTRPTHVEAVPVFKAASYSKKARRSTSPLRCQPNSLPGFFTYSGDLSPMMALELAGTPVNNGKSYACLIGEPSSRSCPKFSRLLLSATNLTSLRVNHCDIGKATLCVRESYSRGGFSGMGGIAVRSTYTQKGRSFRAESVSIVANADAITWN